MTAALKITLGTCVLLVAAAWGAHHYRYYLDSDFRQAMEAVEKNSKDPFSLVFRGLRVVPADPFHVVCGEYNGKNTYGAYAGFTEFYSIILLNTAIANNRSDDPEVYEHHCINGALNILM